jgi:tetratricopeptide (TPR) repeat protein
VRTRPYHFLALIGILTLISGCGQKDNGVPKRRGQFTPANITLKEHGALKELVDESLTFVDSSGVKWIAPKGTLTDGASVPRLALTITNGQWDAQFLKAAVVHDAYCQQDNDTRNPDQWRKQSWKVVHKMFYEASIAGGTSQLLANLMYAAVLLAGPRWDDPEGEKMAEVSSDALTRAFGGSKEWIEHNNPTVEEIEQDIDRREPLLHDLYKLETAILTILGDRKLNTKKLDALLRDEEAVLAQALAKLPADFMVLNFKGYWHKNRAILYDESKRDAEKNKELIDSERTFKSVIARAPEDPSALNGLGSVSIMRGDLDDAEKHILKALAIAPNYQEAKHDLQLIKVLRNKSVK